ncbi:MAG TPA: TonB-dependent receptor [Chitinophagaceae bacterium]|nr:TonB-dependent receptor [Chitinophagaceae bacterium]
MRKVVACLYLIMYSSFAWAQNIKGRVIDAQTLEPVTGATVSISSVHKSALTGLDGSFEIKGIRSGTYTLSISSVSYNPYSLHVNADNAATLPSSIMLTPSSGNLATVTIVGRNTGNTDASARQIEKVSDNVLNILSNHQLQLMPDVTVANVLRRVSGVTVDRGSSGEGRYPVIRGMDKRYNYTLVNGIKIPSPDDKNRYVPMDLFPSEMLQRLEVVKSLTPDMEGDAIGGAMNLVMKDAPEKLEVNAQAALGYSQMLFNHLFTSYDHKAVNVKSPAEIHGDSYTPMYSDFSTKNLTFSKNHPLPDGQAGFTIGNRFIDQKLGVILSGSYQSTNRNSSDLFFSLSPQPDPIPNSTQPELTDEQIRNYSIHEDRMGIHAKLDYRFNDKNELSFYTVFIQLNNYQSRLITDSSQTLRSGPGTGAVDYQYRSMGEFQSIYNATLHGQHAVSDHFNIDWSAVYSRAVQKAPDRAELTLSQVFTTDTATGKPVANGDPILSGLQRIWQHNSDQDISGYLNLHYKFTVHSQQLEIGIGGMARHKNRSNYYNEYDFNYPTNTPFTNIENAPFTPKNSGTLQSPNTYDATEDILAGYGEVRWVSHQRWTVLAGIRFEHTSQSYDQVTLPESVPAKSGTVTYLDPLPSLQVKYKLNNKSALHLAYFGSISRPGFFEIVPYVFPGEYYTEVGNYKLKHVKANNIDFRYELFPGVADQFLAGIFYKNIIDPIEYVYERPATSESVIEPENVGTATNIGAELVYTHYIHKFGISANYTYTHSNIPTIYKYYYAIPGKDTVTFFTKNRPLQGQAAHIGNLSFLYKDPKPGLELQLAMIYTGRHIVYLSQYGAPNGSLDYWQRGTMIIDLSGEKNIGKHFSAYAKFNNLLNTADIVEMMYPPSAYQKQFWPDASKRDDRILVEKKKFGQTYLIGVRYHL